VADSTNGLERIEGREKSIPTDIHDLLMFNMSVIDNLTDWIGVGILTSMDITSIYRSRDGKKSE